MACAQLLHLTRSVAAVSSLCAELLTPAAWQRAFVMEHPDYQHDSMVPQSVAHDLLRALSDIAEGRRHEPTLLGQQWVEPLRTDDAWPTPLGRPAREKLLARYAKSKQEPKPGMELEREPDGKR